MQSHLVGGDPCVAPPVDDRTFCNRSDGTSFTVQTRALSSMRTLRVVTWDDPYVGVGSVYYGIRSALSDKPTSGTRPRDLNGETNSTPTPTSQNNNPTSERNGASHRF